MFLELLGYSPALGSQWAIGVEVNFDGFLPILGGREAKVKVEMDVDLRFDAKTSLLATSEITKLVANLNSKALPFNAKSTQEFFPKTRVLFEPTGVVKENDAPDKKLPVNLPGLDVKRFPDLSYLPIQFPKEDVKVGQAFEFDKVFNGAKVHYRVTPTEVTTDAVNVKVELSQDLVSYEDDRANPVEKDVAKVIVKTKLAGEGKGSFSRKLGLFTDFSVEAVSKSEVTDPSGTLLKPRSLKTVLKIVAKPKP